MELNTIQKYVKYKLSPFFSGKVLDDISNSKLFELAFTHPSYDKKNNFEYLEFRGDAAANLAIAQYIRIRFQAIKSAKWLNKLNLALHSTQYMSTIAKKEGFQNYVRLGPNHKIISSLDKDKLMEDLLEAFCGAVLCYCDEHFEFGSGYSIVFSIITGFFEKHIYLDLRYETFFDIKSRVKEMVEANIPSKPKWTFNPAKIVKSGRDQSNTIYTAYYDIYPNGDKSPIPENKVTLKETGKTEEEATTKIYDLALLEMGKYGLEEVKCDPYQNDFYNKYSKEDILDEISLEYQVPLLTDAFRESMRSFFKKTNMTDTYIQLFLEEANLIEFRKCFIDQSYNPSYNFDLYIAEGENIFNFLVNTHISQITKSINEHTCTNVKQRLSEGFKISQMVFQDFKFDSFMLYGEAVKKYIKTEIMDDSKNYQKLKKACFKSLLGCFLYYIDRKTFPGVSCNLLYHFIKPYFAKIEIREMENPYSTLKNYYDRNEKKLGGKLKQMTTVTQTKVDEIPYHTVQIKVLDVYKKPKVIAEATEKLVDDAKREASRIALKYFKIS